MRGLAFDLFSSTFNKFNKHEHSCEILNFFSVFKVNLLFFASLIFGVFREKCLPHLECYRRLLWRYGSLLVPCVNGLRSFITPAVCVQCYNSVNGTG